MGRKKRSERKVGVDPEVAKNLVAVTQPYNDRAVKNEYHINLRHVEMLAAQGLNDNQIAYVLGVSIGTISNKKEKHIAFRQAIELGRSQGVAHITNALYKSAEEGNFHAQKFYLTNRDPDNWRDKSDTVIKGHDGGAVKVEWEVNVIS